MVPVLASAASFFPRGARTTPRLAPAGGRAISARTLPSTALVAPATLGALVSRTPTRPATSGGTTVYRPGVPSLALAAVLRARPAGSSKHLKRLLEGHCRIMSNKHPSILGHLCRRLHFGGQETGHLPLDFSTARCRSRINDREGIVNHLPDPGLGDRFNGGHVRCGYLAESLGVASRAIRPFVGYTLNLHGVPQQGHRAHRSALRAEDRLRHPRSRVPLTANRANPALRLLPGLPALAD
ncbi:unnamed protein product, partial [Ectocarpus sp. 13 AM-2016]